MKSLHSFESPGTVRRKREYCIQRELNLQQHRCENIKIPQNANCSFHAAAECEDVTSKTLFLIYIYVL